eukprot:TRINITY_DN9189_c0_g1_i1.p1 TRINITY_DN9189_c0_g1~~TRINITY_DN9189_c0_g1_i1.p1  ORF type:complete len:108 (-),score=21.17 TRINITY_DN9189_c0_g1_i1:195-518(-)
MSQNEQATEKQKAIVSNCVKSALFAGIPTFFVGLLASSAVVFGAIKLSERVRRLPTTAFAFVVAFGAAVPSYREMHKKIDECLVRQLGNDSQQTRTNLEKPSEISKD